TTGGALIGPFLERRTKRSGAAPDKRQWRQAVLDCGGEDHEAPVPETVMRRFMANHSLELVGAESVYETVGDEYLWRRSRHAHRDQFRRIRGQ
ncbi:MAG: hypothetical protein JWL73_747, partial [Actinomycetia bacterium]|nr:hypothetical protein [Actinomycetes bacterium]